MRLLIYTLITTILVLSSCTIEKRAFRKGYYISWNKSVPKEKPASKSETETREPTAQTPILKDTIRPETPEQEQKQLVLNKPEEQAAGIPSKADSTPCAEQTLPNEPETEKSTTVYSEKALLERLEKAVESVKEQVARQEEEEEAPGKRLNLFALNSFVLAAGYVILLFVAFNSSQNFPVVGAVICFFAAIAFAIVGLVKWRRNHDGFWGTFFALMALILLVTGSFIFFIYVMMNTSFG